MSIEQGPPGVEAAWDCEAVSLASVDYVPVDQAGKPVICRGLTFSAMTSLVIVTGANTTITYAAGELQAGLIHPIHFRKILKSGTSVTNLKAYT